MAAREGRHFVAIAATGHGAPASPTGARGVIEKEAAVRVGADAKAGGCTFRDELGGGTSDGRKEPVQTTLACDEFQAPFTVLLEKFVMAFGNAEDFIDWLYPISLQWFFIEKRIQGLVQSSVEPLGLAEERVGTLGVSIGQGK
jgi:hypothetical protein